MKIRGLLVHVEKRGVVSNFFDTDLRLLLNIKNPKPFS
jgi:hypothetical protein